MTLETANREQVGRALDLARDGLRPYVERELKRSPRGLGQVRDALAGTDYAEAEDPLSDIAAIVLVIRRRWQEVFQPRLRRTIRGQVRSHVGEVGSTRNRWAHQESFSDADAIRAVDTIHRLLRDVRAKEAEQVERVLVELRAREAANAVVSEPPVPEPEPEPAPVVVPEPEHPAASTDAPVHDDEEYQRVLARRIDSLYQQIAGKRAEREQLNGEARRLEAEQQRIAGDLAGVVAERENVEAAIQRLEDELRRVEHAIAPPAVDEPAPASVAEPETPVAPPAPVSRDRNGPSPTNQASADLVHEILIEAGQPLHYREIYKRYEQVRHRDPKPPRSRSGNPANALATRYRHDPRIENVGRGMYALRGAHAAPSPAPTRQRSRARRRSGTRYTSARPAAWTLFGERHEVRTFRDVLLGVCDALHERAPSEFERVLELRGRARPYFSRNPDDLLTPVQVARSGIFAETKLGATGIVERCQLVIELCGFDPREFDVETR